jgi:hypothetical protein
MTFLTPLAALVALAAVLPALAFVAGGRRLAQVRAAVGLPRRPVERPLAVVAACAVVVLLGVAAAQPAWKSTSRQKVRTDAQALFVVDISQSMAASNGPRGRTRLQRAVAVAERMRRAIPQVASGVATLTDRILPDLLPVPDAAAFDATLERSLAIEEPPPQSTDVRATSFGALAGIPARGYFAPGTKTKLVVLLSDGESAPYDASAVRRAFAAANVRFVSVHIWNADEHIYDNGRPDTAYRPDPRSAELLRELGSSFGESDVAAAAGALRADAGSGPTKTTGRAEAIHPLGPWVALAALLPLALVFRRRGVLLPA